MVTKLNKIKNPQISMSLVAARLVKYVEIVTSDKSGMSVNIINIDMCIVVIKTKERR